MENDEQIRKELSQMLDAPFQKKGQYDYGEQERIVFSWPQIYYEIGKLKQRQKALQYVEDIETMRLELQELRVNTQELEHNVRTEIHPNLPTSTIKRNFP